MYYLHSERLQVAVADPAEVRQLTTRFDRTGFITEVILDQSVRFCASEPRNMKSPSSGGRGLCSEFCFDAAREAKAGGYFPKFGVGLLKKTEDADFCFHKKYEYVPFEHTAEQVGESEIFFRTLPSLCMGYAVESMRRICVEDNRIIMQTRLSNVGTRVVTFREYCHNFLSLDGMALGPEYTLTLPGGRNMDQRVLERKEGAELFAVHGSIVRPRHASFAPASFQLNGEDICDEVPFVWRLHHDGAAVTVEGTEFFKPSGVKIWANDHMLCPEVFFHRSLQPGQSCQWKRQWSFQQMPRRVE